MTATAPLVCKPLGTLPLAEVQAFPPAAARDLERAHEVRTLFDLQPHVEKHGNDVNAVRKAFVMLDVRKEHLDQCTWSVLRHLHPSTVPIAKPTKTEPKPRKRKGETPCANSSATAAANANPATSTEAATHSSRMTGINEPTTTEPKSPAAASASTRLRRKPEKQTLFSPSEPDHGEGERTTIATEAPVTARASASHDAPTPSPSRKDLTEFDEHTPPPRTRPRGEQVPHFIKVPAGESVINLFFEWNSEGRIPAGSVLCEFRGSDFGTRPAYMVAATVWPPPLGEPGEELPDAKLDGWRVRVSIEQRAKRGQEPVKHVVMSPG